MDGREVKQGGESIKVAKMVFLFVLTPPSGHWESRSEGRRTGGELLTPGDNREAAVKLHMQDFSYPTSLPHQGRLWFPKFLQRRAKKNQWKVQISSSGDLIQLFSLENWLEKKVLSGWTSSLKCSLKGELTEKSMLKKKKKKYCVLYLRKTKLL